MQTAILLEGQLFFSTYATVSEFIGEEPSENSIANEFQAVKASSSSKWEEVMNAWREDRYPILKEDEGFGFEIGTRIGLSGKNTFNLNQWKKRVQNKWSAGISVNWDFHVKAAIGLASLFDRDSEGVNSLGIMATTQFEYEDSLEFSSQFNKKVSTGRRNTFKGEVGGVFFVGLIPVYVSAALDIKPYVEADAKIGLNFSKEVSWVRGDGFLYEKNKGIQDIGPGKKTLKDTSWIDEAHVELEGDVGIGVEIKFTPKLYKVPTFSFVPDLGIKLTGTVLPELEARGDVVFNLSLSVALLELLKEITPDFIPIHNLTLEWEIMERKWNIFKLPKEKVTGTVVNATNLQPIPGAKIVFRDVIGGAEKGSATTDSNGKYEAAVSLARYYVEITADGYRPYGDLVQIDEENLKSCDFEMSPDDGTIRIILRWGLLPLDLDSHLTGPRVDGTRFHIYYQNMSDINNANLDVDDVTSFGPETVTIMSLNPGIYRYSVHDFTNRESTSSAALMNSGASVRLDLPRGSFHYAYPQGNGTLWTVFEIHVEENGLYSVVPINRMSYVEDPGFVRSTNSSPMLRKK